MSGIYIKCMEMPKAEFTKSIKICSDGVTFEDFDSERPNAKTNPVYKAVHVPPHGRLIDADALLLKLLTAESGKVYDYCYPCKEVLQAIKDSPTIIERETN